MKANNNLITTAPAAPAVPVRKLPKGMPHDKSLLLSVFRIQNPSNNRACNDHAIKTITDLAPPGCTVIRYRGNLLIRKGDINDGPMPFFLSHMDQVHDYVPFMKVSIASGVLQSFDGNNARCGVGGDDKCGIYLALLMLHHLERCTAVFVRDEEVGCEGSGEVPLSWFSSASFVIQADRNNRTMDIIRDTNGMICASDEFMDAMLTLPIARAAGHAENTGSITDIGELATRRLGVSMVNISSGYHNPHTSREIVHLDELGIACQLAFEAATQLGHRKWDHAPSSYRRTRQTYGNYGASYYDSRGNSAWAFDEDEKGIGQFDTEDDDLAFEMHQKEQAIRILVGAYGYDREFDNLDAIDAETLFEMVDDCETADEIRGEQK